MKTKLLLCSLAIAGLQAMSNLSAQNCHAGFTSTVNGTTVTFTNTSTGNSKASYIWYFKDGTYLNSSLQNPTHTYTYNGTYNVALFMFDTTASCNDTAWNTVVITGGINPPCGASFQLIQDSTNTNSLTWEVYPNVTGTAPFTYLWNFGDGTISTQAYPQHTYSAAGHYNICLTITDAVGCSSSTCDSTYRKSVAALGGIMKYVNVVNPNANGIQENSLSVNSIFPNPAHDLIEISLNQSIAGDLKIIDLTGREVYSEKVNAASMKINVSNLPVGFYNLSIVSGTRIIHEKIMIAR